MKINCADAITLVSGRLMMGMGRVYDLYNFLLSDNLYTHQLPRAFRECLAHVRAQVPTVAAWCDEHEKSISTANFKEKLALAVSALGDEFEVTALERPTHKDPLMEAEELVGKDRVISVVIPRREN